MARLVHQVQQVRALHQVQLVVLLQLHGPDKAERPVTQALLHQL